MDKTRLTFLISQIALPATAVISLELLGGLASMVLSVASISTLLAVSSLRCPDAVPREILFSGPVIFMALLPGVSLVVCTSVFVLNLGVATFSDGTGYMDTYRSVVIPLLITGIVAGSGLYVGYSDDLGDVEDAAVDVLSQVGPKPDTGDTRDQVRALSRLIASRTLDAAQDNVTMRAAGDLDPGELEAVSQAFDASERKILKSVSSSVNSSLDRPSRREVTRELITGYITPKSFLLVVPASGVFLYGLHPLLGLSVVLASLPLRRLLEPGLSPQDST